MNFHRTNHLRRKIMKRYVSSETKSFINITKIFLDDRLVS